VRYSEGILVGYRHLDKNNIEPLFPFGFGLSYTEFSYSNLSITPNKVRKDGRIQVTCDIQNVGKRSGAEVAQLYVSDVQSSVERPPKELKGFKKVFLEPGEKKQVCFEIDITTLSFFDSSLKDWNAEPGVFRALVGSSSRDIKLEGAFELF
jgi:beta-glucosidase